jgi:hypothetical protein
LQYLPFADVKSLAVYDAFERGAIPGCKSAQQ